jgi:cytochrome c553
MNRWYISLAAVLLIPAPNGPGVRTVPKELRPRWRVGLVCQSPGSQGGSFDFDRDIRPIFASRCIKCHARGQRKGGFSIETRASLLAGGDSGPGVTPGKSGDSLMIELVTSDDPSRAMPQKGERLSKKEIAQLSAWIDAGALWPEGFSFGFPRAPVAPRRPTLPDVARRRGDEHPIDRLLLSYDLQHHVPRNPVVNDRMFARRAFLDLIGLLPAPGELDRFERDADPAKREHLVQRLLGDRQSYAAHWLTFWNDALRNAYHGTGYIDGGRQQITDWLFRSLFEDKPYDEFVRELVSPVPGSEGFAKGIVWRGVVNASQQPPMQAAQNVAQVFLGTNLKCASCHDSFVNYWKLRDAYALASVFSDAPLELNRCDKPTGEMAEPGFIFPEIGAIDPSATRAERQRQLAELLTSPQNGRLARTVVNRLWAWFFGRGIVEPIDDMDQPPWNTDLLDWLASDLVDHGYDLKHTMELICTSRAYQRPSIGVAAPDDKSAWVFRGPLVKRLTAEQFVDAVSSLTGVKRPVSAPMVESDGRAQGGQLNSAADIVGRTLAAPDAGEVLRQDTHWVWSHVEANKNDPGGRIWLRKQFHVADKPSHAVAVACGDNEFVLFVNGKKAGSSSDWQKPMAVDLGPLLVAGTNTVAVEAINWPDPESEKTADYRKEKVAGFAFFAAGFRDEAGAAARSSGADEAPSHALFAAPTWTLATDETWLWSNERAEGWEQPNFDTARWRHVAELGGISADPWKLEGKAIAALRRQLPTNEVRSVLFNEDPLTRALGRPNREQVVTRRDSIATTLQALELSNGATLEEILRSGAGVWLHSSTNGADLARRIFEVALGRRPSASEMQAALGVLGEPATQDGVEDLLWVVLMLPEFQMIH